MLTKAMVFALGQRGLLLFSEPDFPEVPLQVPGGTIEGGEAVDAAARREFEEETGRPLTSALDFLGSADVGGASGATVRHLFFSSELHEDLPETWDHFERYASSGFAAGPEQSSAPILFRFNWYQPRGIAPTKMSRPTAIGLRMLLPFM